MNEKEYLNEERYQKNKKKLKLIAVLILIVGFMISGGLVTTGLIKNRKVDLKFSDENKKKILEKLDIEKEKLEIKKLEIKSKGIESSTNYEDGEAYDLYSITEVLDPSINRCTYSEYKNNSLTSDYCSIRNEYEYLLDERHENSEKSNNIPLFAFAVFPLFIAIGFSSQLFLISKGREIGAFSAQQVMPVAKEGIDEIAPTVGQASAKIAKEMAPAYGEVAKEISKGIKEGISENEKSNE